MYDATLYLGGDRDVAWPVVVDLTDDRVTMSIGGEEVGDWARESMRISAMPDGFHIRTGGKRLSSSSKMKPTSP